MVVNIAHCRTFKRGPERVSSGAKNVPPTKAALRIEGLRGNPKKMACGAGLIHDFQPPFGAVAKPRDGVSDHLRACPCGLVSSSAIIRQIDGPPALGGT
jgi:hypothetical protein